ncbi:MAG: hypothetical protein CVU56_27495 [Deltaproteobacteria bacterium HGW-Deltaproteobacteria-14]|nr:MAG: hypothetical protein CVU56_27495 [Deltaproteobacteria bacterium HGW-Deltaproteobacteria-14]
MDDLTAYFITLDRPHAAAALVRLEREQGLVHPVVVVRGVRPLARAFASCLACPTEYCLVLDEDVLLAPWVVVAARAELVARRGVDPGIFLLSGDRFGDDGGLAGGGGFKIYHLPSLRRVGFPDAPHMSFEQERRAAELGLRKLSSCLVVGARGVGTATDVYKRVLWDQIRWNVVQSFRTPRPDLRALRARARATGDPRWWAAALGALDGALVGRHAGSKDDLFRGPIAGGLDLEVLDPPAADRLVTRHLGAWRRALLPLTLHHVAVRQGRRLRRVVRALARRVGGRAPR